MAFQIDPRFHSRSQGKQRAVTAVAPVELQDVVGTAKPRLPVSVLGNPQVCRGNPEMYRQQFKQRRTALLILIRQEYQTYFVVGQRLC